MNKYLNKYLNKSPEELLQQRSAIDEALEQMSKQDSDILGIVSKRYVDSINEPKKAEAYLKFIDEYSTKEEKKLLKNTINRLKKISKQTETDINSKVNTTEKLKKPEIDSESHFKDTDENYPEINSNISEKPYENRNETIKTYS